MTKELLVEKFKKLVDTRTPCRLNYEPMSKNIGYEVTFCPKSTKSFKLMLPVRIFINVDVSFLQKKYYIQSQPIKYELSKNEYFELIKYCEERLNMVRNFAALELERQLEQI